MAVLIAHTQRNITRELFSQKRPIHLNCPFFCCATKKADEMKR